MTEKAHGIMFHHFHDDDFHIKGQGSIDRLQFKSMIVWLKKNFNLINADEWYEKAISDKLNSKDICITFDDNLKCQFDIALPVLEEFNLTAFWFIYTSPFEGIKEKIEIYRYFRFSEFNSIEFFYESFYSTLWKSKFETEAREKLKAYEPTEFLKHFSFYSAQDKEFRFIRDHVLKVDKYYEIMDQMILESDMDIDEVSKKLWNNESEVTHLEKAGHIIGLHSHTHPTEIKHLSIENQKLEYQKNQTKLTQIIGKKIKTVSHPCNSYDSHTLEILRGMNVNFGFRANMEDGFHSELEYPRLDHAHLMDKI